MCLSAVTFMLLLAGCDNFNRPLEPYVRENLSKVRAISVSPAQAGVSRDASRLFTASVTAFYDAAATVTWSVTGGVSGPSASTITPDGVLTVGPGEGEGTRLTVRAVSTWDPRKSAEAVVTVRGPYTVTFNLGVGEAWAGSAPSSSPVNYGDTVDAPSVTISPPNPSFTLDGWYTGSGSRVSFPYRPEANTTLSPRWKYSDPVDATTWGPAITLINGIGTPFSCDIDIGSDLSLPPATEPVYGGHTLTITGSGTITLSGEGNLLNVASGGRVILDGPTLVGLTSNNAPLVFIQGGGSFTLQNGSIRNNQNVTTDGGGVYVTAGGTFTMNGGTITSNTSGGGVYVGGTFTLNTPASRGSVHSNSPNQVSGGGTINGTAGVTAGW
jgi:hypothetical protein